MTNKTIEKDTLSQLNREELAAEILTRLELPNTTTKLPWYLICKYTGFDSFATAFSLGIGWKDENITTMPLRQMRIALFNLMYFPKQEEEKRNGKPVIMEDI